jgi:hypothetical protein
MAAVELIVGGVLVAVSAFAHMIALPKDGEVLSFLRNEHAQAYYTIVIIGAFVYGMVNLFVGERSALG